LRTHGVALWIEGGWGVDALLGEQTDLRRLSERFGLELSERCRERPGFLAPKRRSGAV
jgi:hypothetical protein